jgi:hypothetical protein
MTDDITPHIPSDAELDAARYEVEQLLGGSGVDLSDPALWEAAPDLEDLIMAETSAPEHHRATPWWRLAAAASVVAVAAIGVVAFGALRSAPDWSVALAATDLAPDAVATIDGWNEPSGTRVRLAVDGLPPAPEGFFYELWFSEGPTHISAGSFRETDGVEMWAGVTRAEFPRLWITLEPIDEDEAPSGDTVLDTG